MPKTETFDQETAGLEVHTGVAGRSAKLGHRLTLAPKAWKAELTLTDDEPTGLTVTVDAASLDVVAGEGGLKALSAPERGVARGNAHKSLKVKQYPEIEFRSTDLARTESGFAVTGQLTICGVTKPCEFALEYGQEDPVPALTGAVPVRQSDFGIKPFSLMMGTLSVADEVTVLVHAIP